jgi:Redoxin
MLRARCVVVATVFCGLIGCAKDDTDRLSPQPIRLFDLDGQAFDLWQKPDAITIVLFARTDCPISNRCAPEIRRLYETYHSRGVEFFVIYVDPREQPEAIRRHLHEYGYPCPGLRDPKQTLAAHCGATTTPEAVVFDKNHVMTYRGRVDDLYLDVGRSRPEPTTHDLSDAIESTFLGQPVAKPRTPAIGCLIADLKE